MVYRTKTYIAADWSTDKEIVDKLREWNNSGHYALSFTDAHDLKQAYDTSLPCTIKRSLADKLNVSKTFVLIVGANTKKLTQGSCQYCNSYSAYSWSKCSRNHSVDYRSYIEYECEKAIKDGLKIVVIYNYANVDKNKCPDCIKSYGSHLSAYYYAMDGKCYWNISRIKEAINN